MEPGNMRAKTSREDAANRNSINTVPYAHLRVF